MSTSRLESFSDGVIAVAITLLALNLPLPPAGRPDVAAYLGNHWPDFAAFVVSFITIGIIWLNHNAMVRRIVAVDSTVLLLNLVLLMTICTLPFSTALIAECLRTGHQQSLAAAIWSGSFLLMGLAFVAMQRHLILVKTHLLAERLTPAVRAAVLRRNAAGVVPYAIGCLVAPLTPYLTLAICAAVAVFYALPGTLEIDAPAAEGT